ncbi:hypothetical protein TIFTF001_000346 [Ficus carica]|uniref:Late embryogenesis abundant protein LEA-2 subgroup domain-containing protein n=1 Tax=Ficus carica TaxID=3494 RepID=A0AA87Z1V1_FICCA|nr:hypothetical protein TIFTF001_000346 [Ficus carica]
MKSSSTNSHKCLKICCVITTIFLIIVAVVFTTLWFTVLKPKDPEITAHPDGLETINPFSMLVITNLTLNMTFTIDNHRNVGTFKFKNATGYLNYHGDIVAEIPIGKNFVAGHGKLNVTSSVDLMVSKIISNPLFFNDVGEGSLNLTATSALHGKVFQQSFLDNQGSAFS